MTAHSCAPHPPDPHHRPEKRRGDAHSPSSRRTCPCTRRSPPYTSRPPPAPEPARRSCRGRRSSDPGRPSTAAAQSGRARRLPVRCSETKETRRTSPCLSALEREEVAVTRREGFGLRCGSEIGPRRGLSRRLLQVRQTEGKVHLMTSAGGKGERQRETRTEEEPGMREAVQPCRMKGVYLFCSSVGA